MGLSVIIPSKTLSNLIPCVEAVWESEPDARILVIDDCEGQVVVGTSETTPIYEWIGSIKRKPIAWINGSRPFVFARNINLGITHATHLPEADWDYSDEEFGPPSDAVVLLNDDAVLKTLGGFTAMQKQAEANPKYGIISATTNQAGNPNQFPQGVGLRMEARTVTFICVLIPRRTIQTVGLLDERFTGYGADDDDYCLRVRKAGLMLGIFDGCYVDHGSLRSTFRGAPTAPGDYSSNHELFKQKWGQDIWGNAVQSPA